MKGRTCLQCFCWVEDDAIQAHWNRHAELGDFTDAGHAPPRARARNVRKALSAPEAGN